MERSCVVYYRMTAGKGVAELDRQRKATGRYTRLRGITILDEYTDILRSNGDARKGELEAPELHKSMDAAELLNVPMIIPYEHAPESPTSIVRVLHARGIPFYCVNRSDVCHLTAGAIIDGSREKESYAHRLVRERNERNKGGRKQRRAERYQSLVEEALQVGCRTPYSIAALFTENQVPTVTGLSTIWTPAQVRPLLHQMGYREL